ncbi:nuclear transport factor 2 family protein [Stenotrophomonas sp.]|uniref:nuclear transport factor 2 family protein n=1 Tax=Stenotrophomonas sp. TaxID=69392 RepID=UPI0028A7DACA|nr:nuclear transport factor 2 family protein [Stenotrophomonas sp.]
MNTKLLSLLLLLSPLAIPAAQAAEASKDNLHDTIAALDHGMFDSFNHCSDPAQFEKHAGYFDPAVEFYHDNGGVTWTREAMLANTRNNVCGHYTRQLLPGTLEVFPIKDFGAIARGQHQFCDLNGEHCDGLADFVIIWRLRDGQWQATRVLSYAHRASRSQES